MNLIQNDIGVTAFANTDNCTYTQPLTVTVTNFAPRRTDSLRIGWSLNGIIQPTVYANTSINFNNTANITLNSSFTFTEFTNYNFVFWTSRPNGFVDTVHWNDTFRTQFYFLGNALAPTGIPTSQCGNGNASLRASGANPSDSISWYTSATGGTLLGFGTNFVGPYITGSRTFYAQGIRLGRNTTLTPTANTAVNVTQTQPYGGMLNVTVSRRVVLDSLLMRMWYNVPNTGYQLYYRVGGFAGFQTNSSAWTLLSEGTSTFFVQGGQNFARVSTGGGLLLEPGNTYGFYFVTQVNSTYPTGNCVASMNAGPTVNNTDMTIVGGGSIIIGQFGATQVLNNWHPQMAMVYKTLCEGGTRTAVLVTVKPKPVTEYIKGAPFAGIQNLGLLVQPDVAEVGKENTYEIVNPNGYTNAGHNNTWAITGIDVRTRYNYTVPTTEYDTIHPTATSNGKFIIKATSAFLDSFLNFRTFISDFGPNNCDTVISRWVVIAPTPKVNFKFNSQTCLGTTTYFENLSTIHSGQMTYKWYFGTSANDSADDVNPDFTYQSSGKYNVRLIATSFPWGVVNDTTIEVDITDVPDVKFAVRNKCEGQAVEFNNQTTVSGTGAIIYTWNFGDNSPLSNATNPTHLYSIPDGYRVTLTADYNGCKTSLTKTAYQFPNPDADFSMVSATCATSSVDFTNNTTIKFGKFGSYWTFGDGGISTVDAPSHTYQNNGNYNVRLISVSEFDCRDTVTKPIQIRPTPKPDFSADILCSLTPTKLTNTTVEDLPNPVYTWTFHDGSTSNSKNAIRNWPNEGLYPVKLKVQYSNGCNEEVTKNLEVKIQADAKFTVEDICSGETASFVNQSKGDKEGILYNWDLGTTTSTDRSPRLVYSNPSTTSYTIRMIAYYASGCADTAFKVFTVNEFPVCEFDIQNNGFMQYTFTAQDQTLAKYYWMFGQGTTATTATASHQYTQKRIYDITLVAENIAGCECRLTKKIEANTSIEMIDGNSLVKIYPNPNSGKFTISNINSAPMKIEVFNLIGELIHTQNSDNNSTEVSLNNVASGVYTVKVTIEDQVYTAKMVITE